MLKSVVVAICVVFASIASAAAQKAPLTEDTARRFVDSLTAVETLGDSLKAEGKSEHLAIETAPEAGELFKPYSSAVMALQEKYPSDHARLASAVKAHGFSAADWGAVGDRVIVAYLAIRMELDDPQTMAVMEGMDASMMEMAPPEMREQLARTFSMLETVKNAPDEDKRVVMTLKDALEAYMEKERQ